MRNILLSILILAMAPAFLQAAQNRTGRPLHYISTDKQIYHPGETVYMRAVVLDGMTNYPLNDFLTGYTDFEWKIVGPKGDSLADDAMEYEQSVGAVSWKIPDDAAGGIYKFRVAGGEAAPAERTFEVRAYRAPRIRTQIDFLKRGYLPGEEVTAVVKFSRAEGDAVQSPKVSAAAILDGAMIFETDEAAVDGDTARVSFKLPAEVKDGIGTLNFTVHDGGVSESAGKSIPVLLDNYTVDFYPEGGDLAADVPGRIYVEARQKNGIGADIAGVVKDADGQAVVDFSTIFDGRGIIEFTPKKGVAYTLEIRNAATGQTRVFALPEAKSGSLIAATRNAYGYNEAIVVKIATSADATKTPGYVTLRKRDKELSRVAVKAGQTEATLDAGEREGVLIATLYATDDTPLAERLIFRRPKFRVHTTVSGLDRDYTPGEKVTLVIETRDDAGTPVAANVGLTVTDASVAEMKDRRDIAPRLPAMVYLENEVHAFADAGDYFDPGDPLADAKIDLLLGTQGWRRFIPLRKTEIAKQYEDALRRALAPEIDFSIVPMPIARGRGPGILYMMANAYGAGPKEAVYAQEEDGLMLDFDEGAEVRGGEVIEEAAAEAPAEALDEVEFPAMAKHLVPRRPWIPEVEEWVVREYAHQARKDRKPGDRVDFQETVYWSANLLTDPRTGKREVSFELPDTIGAFKVMADSFGNNGALGEATAELRSVQPFYAEVKMPLFLTAGDQAILPVTLVNMTKAPLAGANLTIEVGEGLRLVEQPVAGAAPLAPGERRAVPVKVEATKPCTAKVTVKAVAGGNVDAVTREVSILSPLFPYSESAGAKVSSKSPFAFRFVIPAEVENGSQKLVAQVYTSPAATMEAALNALLRQPHGCFEQTSSTNYPLVMAQQYFLSHAGIDPAKVKKAQDLLDEGYKMLISFECREKGYEWFGDDPGHEALTAYGLMEFNDMAKVMPVDQSMLENTRKWLLDRRDGNGGFKQSQRALDSFGHAPAETANAYILWALLESGENPAKLKKEIEAVAKRAAEAQDDYLKALAANILFLAGERPRAEEFGRILAKNLKDDGTMKYPGTTITCSGELSRNLECTSLAALAWIRLGADFAMQTETAMTMLAKSCEAGKFGSTQSTVLVLKAINAYDATFAKPKTPGEAQLYLDGNPFGAPVPFDEKSTGILSLPDCGLALTPGEHTLEIRLTGESELTASMKLDAMTRLNASKGPLRMTTTLDRSEAAAGEPMQLAVRVENATDKAVNMPLAVIAIPGGLEPRYEQLKELRDAGTIASYETRDNTVVLYWRGLDANASVTVNISLTAAFQGKYAAAASRAYPYYDDKEAVYCPGTQCLVK